MGVRARLGQPAAGTLEEASLRGSGLPEAGLDRPVPLTPDHRFPAYSVTKLITATVVLRLVADGQIGLDDPARAHLRTVRPADETVTVRVADVTGGTYPEAATSMVLRPLGMSGSWFPASWPDAGAVTGYHLAGDGSFETAPARVCTVPAAGGLWTTAADLVRFALANRRVPIEPSTPAWSLPGVSADDGLPAARTPAWGYPPAGP